MNNFEKITISPEALGAFLASLPVAKSPWENAFHKEFCAACGQTDCGNCPHEAVRNNPTWWLTLGRRPNEVPRLSINIKTAFSIEWARSQE